MPPSTPVSPPRGGEESTVRRLAALLEAVQAIDTLPHALVPESGPGKPGRSSICPMDATAPAPPAPLPAPPATPTRAAMAPIIQVIHGALRVLTPVHAGPDAAQLVAQAPCA